MKQMLEVNPLRLTYLMMESPIRSSRALLVIVRRDRISRDERRCQDSVLDPSAADLLWCPSPEIETGVLQFVVEG